jgi:hypothetical protein
MSGNLVGGQLMVLGLCSLSVPGPLFRFGWKVISVCSCYFVDSFLQVNTIHENHTKQH